MEFTGCCVDISCAGNDEEGNIEFKRASGAIVRFRSCIYIVTCAHVVLITENVPAAGAYGYPKNFTPFQRYFMTYYRGHLDRNGCNTPDTLKTKQQSIELIGVDLSYDVAILKPTIDIDYLQQPVNHTEIYTKLSIGEFIHSIGNTGDVAPQSLSYGLIRDNLYVYPTSKPIPNMVTIDATIGRGNSGGPIIDKKGRMVGMVSAVFLSDSGTDLNFCIHPQVIELTLCWILDQVSFQWIMPTRPGNNVVFIRNIRSYIELEGQYYAPILNLFNIPLTEFNPSAEIVYPYVKGMYLTSDFQRIPAGSIITSINCREIGRGKTGQVTIQGSLDGVIPGTEVDLVYRLRDENYRCNHKMTIITEALPIEKDLLAFNPDGVENVPNALKYIR
jgi:hypothetical protein